MTTAIVHLGYALMLGALIARDVLWLRALLVGAQTLIATYAWRSGVPAIAAWNVGFVGLNLYWVGRLLRERRAVRLPSDLQRLYDRHFAALTPPEFLRWWRQGRLEVLDGRPLAREGTRPDALYFLLEGTARVSRRGTAVLDLPPGFFVGEMSLLTGDAANADVDAIGEVRARCWPVGDLHALRERDPILWTRIQSVIGHDLVEKIRRPATGGGGT